MGVAGPIFEPGPKNFVKMHNFERCTNDVSMSFGYLYWFQIWKFLLELSYPVLESSLNYLISKILNKMIFAS